MTEPRVVYESPDFLVVEKPAGMIVHHPRHARDKSAPSLAEWLAARYPEIRTVGDDPAERPGIVHRLDKETSGLLVIPRSRPAFEFFKSQFQAHAIRKTYLAAVWGKPREEAGTIAKPIGIKDGSVKRTVHAGKMMKEAVTEFELAGSAERGGAPVSLLLVRPRTGRTHQIRVHLASEGLPILGDAVYGKKNEPAVPPRMMLHAAALEFSSAAGPRLRIDGGIPPEFADIFPEFRLKE